MALSLAIGGIIALVAILFYAQRFYLWMPISAGIMIFLGLYWLWTDYINADPRPEQ